MEIKERIIKLRQMMEGGTDNEKANARKLYDILIKKYDISEKDLDKEIVTTHIFKVKNEIEKELIKMIHSMVTNNTVCQKYIDKRRKNYVIFECSDEDFEIMKMYFDIYNESLKKELEYFLLGFFCKNGIHGKLETSNDEEASLSLEEKLKINNYMNGVDFINRPYGMIEQE